MERDYLSALTNADRQGLTDAQVNALNECECNHFVNEHNETGCLATTDESDGVWSNEHLDYLCPCVRSPRAIQRAAVAQLIAEAVNAERERHGTCICNTGPGTDGPDETCPQHGRPYAYWVNALTEAIGADS